MKPTLTKQTAHELQKYAREINELEAEIQQRKTKIAGDANELVVRAIEIGQKLIQAHLRTKPTGSWLLWLEANVTVKEDQARRYMKLANNAARVRDAQSIRQALALIADSEATESGKEKTKCVIAPDLRILAWAEKFSFGVKQHQLGTWNPGAVERAKELLEPVARELWPERFV